MAAKIPEFPYDKVLNLLKTERAAPNLEACMNFFVSHPVEAAFSPLKLHVKDRRHQVVKALLDSVAAIGGIEGVKSIAPRLDQRDPRVIQLLTEVLVKAGERKILEDLIEKFSQSKKEPQILNLVPPVDSCLNILKMGKNIPQPLMESLEQIVVEDKPMSAPRQMPTAPRPEQKSASEDHEQKHSDDSIEEFSEEDFDAALASIDSEASDSSESESFDLEEPVEDLKTESKTSDEPVLPEISSPDEQKPVKKVAVEDSSASHEDMALPTLELEKPEPKKHKKKKSPHYVKGLKAYNLGKFKRAIKEFNALIEAEGKVPAKVYLYMGIMHAEAGKFEHARAFFETYLKEKPDNPKGTYLYGKVLKELKDWDSLIKFYNRFTTGEIDASPKMKKHIYRELGIANVLVGKYERGFQLLGTLQKVEPDNPEVGYYCALAQFHLHKPSAAAAMLENVIKTAPKETRIARLAQALATKVRSGGV
jgi:tetratricopeptide (TPR) repeat protein